MHGSNLNGWSALVADAPGGVTGCVIILACLARVEYMVFTGYFDHFVHLPAIETVSAAHYAVYTELGVCPLCGFNRLEHGVLSALEGQFDLVAKYYYLEWTSELNVKNPVGERWPVTQHLMDMDPSWACAWHYYDCEGVLGWSHLWQASKWNTCCYLWSQVLVLCWDFISPFTMVFLWVVEGIYQILPACWALLPFNGYVGFEGSQTWCALFSQWVNFILCAAVTIWASGVGPRTSPDQLSDSVWLSLLFLVVASLYSIMVLWFVF